MGFNMGGELQNNLFFMSRKVSNFLSYEYLKKLINTGDLQTHPIFTSDYLAGQYAYQTATSRDKVTKPIFKDEFKFLRELGVEFDHDKAMQVSVHLKEMLDNDNAVVKWY